MNEESRFNRSAAPHVMPRANALTVTRKPVYFGVHEYGAAGQSLLDLHYDMEVGIVCTGIMQRQYKNFQADMKNGEVWLCNMLETHSCRILKSPCKVAVFSFSPEVLASIFALAKPEFDIFSLFWESPFRRPKPTDAGKKDILQIVRGLERLGRADEGRKILWVQAKLIEILLILTEHWKSKIPSPSFESYDRISPSIRCVSQNAGRFVSIFEASKACAMSRNTFSPLFQKTMGMSFPRFALGHRIRQAAMELLQTHNSAKQIADMWGFTDVSHFYRCFEKYYGCTPKQYRMQAQTRGLPE